MSGNIYLVAMAQSTQIHMYHTERPRQPTLWLLPENLTGFETKHFNVPMAIWEELEPNKSYVMHRRKDDLRSYTIRVSVRDDYVEADLELHNHSGAVMRDVVADICCGFRNSTELMTNAIEHAYVKTGGRYRRIIDTDRSASTNGVMPVYPVKGTHRSPTWEMSQSTPYGFGLSNDEVESSMVLLHNGTEREWIATFFSSANEVWFNVAEPWHGCIHSNAFCPVLPDSHTWRIKGRMYYHEGTLDEMVAKYATAMALMKTECGVAPAERHTTSK
jgi:hypothetical protein